MPTIWFKIGLYCDIASMAFPILLCYCASHIVHSHCMLGLIGHSCRLYRNRPAIDRRVEWHRVFIGIVPMQAHCFAVIALLRRKTRN